MLWVHMHYSQPINEASPPDAALGLLDHSMKSIIVILTTAIRRISFLIFPFSQYQLDIFIDKRLRPLVNQKLWIFTY